MPRYAMIFDDAPLDVADGAYAADYLRHAAERFAMRSASALYAALRAVMPQRR